MSRIVRLQLSFATWAFVTLLVGCASGGGGSVGEKMHREMVAEGAVYDDTALQSYVNRIGQRLVKHSDKPGMAFTFTVIDSPDLNAYALPGGYIYINRGLLAFLDSEAELAGVLGHEIGHVTASHHGRQKTASVSNTVLATTVYVLTGSSQVAEASNMYGAELISGYGRDMELEADSLGAQYMYRAGYDPEALLDVIGVLKNQEQYARVKARSAGKPAGTYHGLYASHPRNDQRLQTVIRAAAALDDDSAGDDPVVPGEFRQRMEGLVWGDSVQGEQAPDRYYHSKLTFTFAHPPGWRVDAGTQAIVAQAPQGDATLRISVRRPVPGASPRSALERLASGSLSGGADLEQAGLKGYTAVASSSANAKRLALIDYNGLSYLFEGSATDFTGRDSELLGMIESFRPIHPRERKASTAYHVHFIQVPQGATLGSLAAGAPLPDAEPLLRLLNGYYPRGEPRTGDWIKVIR